MPMNEEVRKAVERMDYTSQPITTEYNLRAWQTIRAELTRLTEIADAVDPLVIRLGEVTTRLEAADALLRECTRYLNPHHYPDTIKRIDVHLSENTP